MTAKLCICYFQGLGCGEPPKIPNSQRSGRETDITYQCNKGYTGGGRAMCNGREWSHTGSCKYITKIMNFD